MHTPGHPQGPYPQYPHPQHPQPPRPPAKEPSFLRAWWTEDRMSLLRAIGLMIALVSYAFLWPRLISVGGSGLVIRNIILHLFVLAWLMLISIGIRSIGSRDVLGAYLLGAFLVPALVFYPLSPVISRIGSNSSSLGIWWVPPFEESALFAAVSLVAWRLYRQHHRRPGALDMMIIGWSIGSGYSIHEDALYGRLMASFRSQTLSAAFGDTYGWAYPTFSMPMPGSVTTYHAGSGALFGLVLGTALLLRSRVRRIMWVVPVFLLFSVLDHASYNFEVFRGPTAWRTIVGHGHVMAVILIVAVPIALLFAYARRNNAPLRLPPAGWLGVAASAGRGTTPLTRIIRLLAVGRYHRGRNAAINAVWRDSLREPDLRSIEKWALVAFSPTGPNR